jgi:hypothetical protein
MAVQDFMKKLFFKMLMLLHKLGFRRNLVLKSCEFKRDAKKMRSLIVQSTF